jgi:hypothetical protein
MALNSVLTPVMVVNGILADLLDEAGNVARVGDQQVGGADLEEGQAVRRQGEDVIQRQRRDDDLVLRARRLDPGMRLLQVGDDVAVGQHRALGHARGAAGVLQEGDVVVADRRPACSGWRPPSISASRSSMAFGDSRPAPSS